MKTLQDWEFYIRQLAGPALWSKAIAANTQTFVTALRADGMTMADVAMVIRMFVRQMAVTDMLVPMGGVYDMPGIAETDSVCMTAPKLDMAMIAQMVANPPVDDDLEELWDEDLSSSLPIPPSHPSLPFEEPDEFRTSWKLHEN